MPGRKDVLMPNSRIARPHNQASTSTINDVARLAGVSIKTVSRVMNDEPNVRADTRNRVREAALALNYSPNLLARTLAGARSFLIALLYDNPNPSYINDMHRGILARARKSGYHLLLEPQESGASDLATNIATLLSKVKLDGVILTPPLCDMPIVLQTIEAARVPYVRISSHFNPERSASVRMDERLAAYEMTHYLLGLGHRDIGFIMGHPQHGGSHLRLSGFQKAMDEANCPLNPIWIKQGYFSYESGQEVGRQFFQSDMPRPSAIFSSNDYMAFGLMAEAQKAGIRIPDDLSIAGFDDVPGSLLIWPHLTTIRQPVFEMAYAATDLLFVQNDNASQNHEARLTTQRNHNLAFELICRESTRRVSKNS